MVSEIARKLHENRIDSVCLQNAHILFGVCVSLFFFSLNLQRSGDETIPAAFGREASIW